MTLLQPGRGRASIPILVLLLACGACGADDVPGGRAREGSGRPADQAAATAGPRAVIDAAGRRHAPGPAPRRIVSLVPASTETLLALGAGDLLVGRTDFDDADAVRALPSVGGGLQPNLEALLSLEPDLVIRFAGPSDPTTPERLDRADIPHFAVRPDRVDDVRDMISDLGALVGRPEAARALVDSIDARLARVRARVRGRDPVRVAYVLGGSPPWVAGSGTFIDDLLEVAGGENAFDDLGDLYAPVSVEELMARDIDLFLLAPGTALDARVRDRAPARSAPAGLETPGPDLGASAAAMARLLHPAAWP